MSKFSKSKPQGHKTRGNPKKKLKKKQNAMVKRSVEMLNKDITSFREKLTETHARTPAESSSTDKKIPEFKPVTFGHVNEAALEDSIKSIMSDWTYNYSKSTILVKAELSGLKISDNDFLAGNDRIECHKCKKSRKYICSECGIALVKENEKSRIPTIKLPFDFIILKDPKETCKKATSSHIRILCPSNSALFVYPVIPDLDPTKVASSPIHVDFLDGSQTLGEYEKLASVTNVVLIDATWKMVAHILKDSRLKGISTVQLLPHESHFWRYQKGNPKSYLSTVEAAYYFCLERWKIMETQPYDGSYDNLLFFFDFFLKHLTQTEPDVIAFKRRRVL
ncbi:DTW domain-containing protein 1 [Cichlidogyrus casuarinus]|uniref:tRNA-uridine aminocarboxypropyltransferase 1 n=1 Tax=Cichlidogyrus casuarinus TaxID=1844966 RepID=A0ABD2PUL4_9PLAT